ncbi:uncharacterized protein LOC129305686 isoform X2 [Prosopis cineraria]|uniref:uncharacterized protein LOC129305686 isoform X2 n=1 Tax=Prosopis cineraria TaxID=364024 RepID=UPI00240EEC42|nr:uncharacterized protein LOC129305686 isoform X2 [Prosopis cineraria]
MVHDPGFSHLLALGFLISFIFPFAYGESSTCLTVYKKGGAPAVFQSPKCPRWNLFDYGSRSQTPARCQSAMLQGRRKSQEDRTLCVLDVRIPFPGKVGVKEVMVGIVAVFDGHNGAEASEMASKLLVEYFVLHTYFLLDATYSFLLKTSSGKLPHKRDYDEARHLHKWEEILGLHELHFGRFENGFSTNFDDSFHLEILKEALLRAIHDIDAKFSEATSRSNLESGSTATAILIADDKILVANIGDSKAFLCSEKFQSPREAKALLLKLYRQEGDSSVSHVWDREKYKLASSFGFTHFSAKELTSDHHPDREDERIRVEAAGGQVVDWGGVSRINGQLAITRAIGDLSFKTYGVISVPEVTDWQALTANDSYLVAASDGVFEKMSLQDVCDMLWEVHSYSNPISEFSPSCSYSLADCVVNTALKKGSMDNVAAVVVPLESSIFSDNSFGRSCFEKREVDSPLLGLQESASISSANGITSDLMQLEHLRPVDTGFERILAEVKYGDIGCFYLSENLDEAMNYKQPATKTDWLNYLYKVPEPLPDALRQHSGSPVNLYNHQNFCFHFGMTVNGANEQCINPESLASFIGLLESIPLHESGSTNGSFDSSIPNMRYVLKKKFGRGSYGEVWLAFLWNCQVGNDTKLSKDNNNFSLSFINFDSYNRNSSSSTHECQNGPSNHNMYILKRIMVERGAAVYLSGLREKYFGEVFLNASMCFEDLLSAGNSNRVSQKAQFRSYGQLKTNDSMLHYIRNSWGSENSFANKVHLQKAIHEDGLNHIARYVESFESQSNEFWLVFHYEGISLSKLMYTVEEAYDTADSERSEQVKHVQILRPSKWWHWLKTTEEGQQEMRNIIWQLLMALKSCHDRNITHRDIKPENMVICFEDQETGRCLKEVPMISRTISAKMRIIDFGSGLDEFTLKHLYGSTGPSRAEQTYEYIPPEALLNATWYQGPTSSTLKYDMWSVGVVMLELVLGTPNVFQISSLTRTLLDRHLEGWNEGVKELAYKN